MVKQKHLWASAAICVLAVLVISSSCTDILGIDTQHGDNPCLADGAKSLPPKKCGVGACSVFVDFCGADDLPADCTPGTKGDADTCGDGLDNDCDGSVDENDSGNCTCDPKTSGTKACYSGAATTRNKGVCQDGTQKCQSGTWGPCEGDVLPGEEINDGLDNDCDGKIDENSTCEADSQQYCYGGPEDTIGAGPCKQGTQTCKDGAWQECIGQKLPSIEICNGFDDDCDSNVDNVGAANSLCVCKPTDPKQDCYLNAGGETIPCDGTQQGECQCGKQTCGDDGQWGPCEGAVTPADKDICNDKDDDCDGVKDNLGEPESLCVCKIGTAESCYDGPPGTLGHPPCAGGMRTCVNGQWSVCLGQVTPAPTDVCDGQVDGDCDGIVDNINPMGPCVCISGTVSDCYDGPAGTLGVGKCVKGQKTCVVGQWSACAGEQIPTQEICDGYDNDCNGLVDDGVPGVGDACNLPQYANTPCNAGTMKCQIGDSTPKCAPNIPPGSIPETAPCDGIDNNCDGVKDNGQFCCKGDGVKSGNETDLDCGGSCDTKCANGKGCKVGIDCQSGNCVNDFCISPTCNDGVPNGGESDADCGLVCPNKCLVGQTCNVDADCSSNLCDPANKKCIQKVTGAPCLQAQECSSNNCVDGVCCNTACNGVCQACTTQKKGGGADGACGSVADNTDPDNDCDADLQATCQFTGLCKAGACALFPAGSICQAAVCTGPSTLNQADTCDGDGACLPLLEIDCTPYACVGNGCKATCVVDSECATGYFCNTPQCQLKKQNGSVCSLGTQCQSGNCADGVCCDTTCAGTCVACNLGGSVGTCTDVGVGQDPANECNGSSQCDGLGQCQKAGGQSCSINAQCVSGNCVDGVCCNTACLGTCVACDIAGSLGVCTNVPANADPANECPNGACNGAGSCQGVVATACLQPSDCANGFCIDGFCCNSACGGTCEGCSALVKGSGADGICGPVAAGSDPANECNPGACNGSGSCQGANGSSCAQGSQCVSGFCIDGVCCNTSCGGICQACNVQNSVGTCASIPSGQDPLNECNPGACDGLAACQGDNGQACLSNNQCVSGFCVDGVCCNTTCTGTCQACSAALKGSGTDGVCGPVATGTDPENDCTQEAVSTCGKTGFCAAGACELYSSGTACATAVCLGPATKSNQDSCNGTGLCQDGGTQDCTPFACNGGQCLSNCVTDAQCAPGNYCDTPLCKPKKANGTACATGGECQSTFCADGVCCSSACGAECKTCALAGSLGTCVNVPAGQADPPICQGAQVCNGTGTCVDTNGQPCATNGECFSAHCTDTVCCDTACSGVCDACTAAKKGSGADGACGPIASGLDPDNECAGAAACNGVSACGLLTNGTTCSVNAECQSGFCVDSVCCGTSCTGLCQACSAAKTGGASGTCAAIPGNTDPDSECATECDGAGACEAPNGNACTSNANCQSGNCADNVCCNNACNGTCQACNLAGLVGTCSNITAGQDPASECSGTDVCSGAGTCVKQNGSSCSSGGECLSGQCADGVCCNSACSGVCQACTAALKGGGLDGVCGSAGAGSDPHNDCAQAPQSSCGLTGACDGAGACAKYASGTVCQDASCTGGTFSPTDTCNGSGTCVDGGSSSCGNYQCNAAGTACLTTCANDSDCTATSYCAVGSPNTCQAKKSAGAACGADNQCTSTHCADGVCCDTACTGACQACTNAKTGQTTGTCANIPSGSDPDSECAGTLTCSGSGACFKDVAAACGSNGECQSGFCADGVCCSSSCTGTCQACNLGGTVGTCTNIALGSDPANECAGSEVCDGQGVCKQVLGSSCSFNNDCLTGFCADGVCCDNGCSGVCDACNLAGTTGLCTPIPNGADPDNECPGDTMCDGGGLCSLFVLGQTCSIAGECLSGSCADGVCCNDACSGTCMACSNAKTGGTDGVCGNVTSNTDPDNECAGATMCDAGACALFAQGAACAVSGECLAGNCVDGVCCDSACSGTCEACSGAKTGGSDGTCSGIPAGADPDSECPGLTTCDGASACTVLAQGEACTLPDGSECASGHCADGFCCDSACSGTCMACSNAKTGGTDGTCGNVPANTDPDSECATECNGAGACEAANGATCLLPSQCQSGFCADGFCCGTACLGLCQACSAAQNGGSNGTCGNVTNGTDLENECSGTTTCNGAGACTQLSNNALCSANVECSSNICVTKCLGNYADSCFVNGDCASGTCNGSPKTCTKGAAGKPCGFNSDCTSNNCSNNVCQ